MGGTKTSRALLLLSGAGLLFLTLWADQNFSDRIAWLTASTARQAARSLVRLLLSIGLSPISLPVGLALVVLGLRGSPPAAPEPHPGAPAYPGAPPGASTLERAATWLGVGPRGLAFLGLALLFALAAGLAAGDQDRMRQPVVAVAAWILGMALALAGGGFSWSWPDRQKAAGAVSRFFREMAGPLAFAAFAFVLRAWALEDIPIVLTGDEGSVGLGAIRFLDGSADNPFNVSWFSFPSLFFWLQSRSIALLGRTIPALRLPAAFVGALTVGGTFALARALFGRRTALFAAGLLAVMPFHVHFSRLGLNNVWDGLFYVAALGLLWRAWRRGSRPAWLLAGLLVGLSQYFYVTSRALPLLAASWLAVAGLADRPRLKRTAPGMVLSLWAGFVAVFPLALFYLRHPADFAAPFLRVAPQAADPSQSMGILRSLALGLAAYTHAPLQPPFYTAGTPLLRSLPAALFLVGAVALALTLVPRRNGGGDRSGVLLVLLWLMMVGIAGGLSDATPAAQRYAAAAPAAALAAAWGLETLLAGAAAAWSRRRTLVLAAGLLLLAFVAYDEGRFYFVEYGPVSALGGSDTLVADRLARTLQGEEDQAQLFFFGGDRMAHNSIRSLPYLVPRLRAQTIRGAWTPGEGPLAGERWVFVFLPGEEADLPAVRAAYPGGSMARELDFEGTLLYTRYLVEGSPAR
jgi:hypothetical protein